MAIEPGDEKLATRLFLVAIKEGHAAELLDCLFNGGSATVDSAGRLVLISAEQVAAMTSDANGD